MLFAPNLDNILRFGSSDGINMCDKDMPEIDHLFSVLDQLPPQGEDNLHIIWFTLPCGPIEAYGDYEELLQDQIVESRSDYERQWKEEYPDETYWYRMSTSQYKEYRMVNVNHQVLFDIRPDRGGWPVDISDFIGDLVAAVQASVEKVKSGEYNEWLAENLPNQYKYGVLSCRKMWELYPEYKKCESGILTAKEIEEFCADTKEMSYDYWDKEVPDNCMSEMTAKKYKDMLAPCYRKAFPDRVAELEKDGPADAETLYRRFADDRDGGLAMIEQDSPEAFEEWFDMSPMEKWDKYTNSSHAWEAVEGGSQTRIHIFPKKCDKGWFLVINCNPSTCSSDTAAMYLALKAQGIPVLVSESETIANILTANVKVGIVPCFDPAWAYLYGGFPDDNVDLFQNLDSIPKAEKFVEWLPVDTINLLEENK